MIEHKGTFSYPAFIDIVDIKFFEELYQMSFISKRDSYDFYTDHSGIQFIIII